LGCLEVAAPARHPQRSAVAGAPPNIVNRQRESVGEPLGRRGVIALAKHHERVERVGGPAGHPRLPKIPAGHPLPPLIVRGTKSVEIVWLEFRSWQARRHCECRQRRQFKCAHI
jgi:hypothetical protein